MRYRIPKGTKIWRSRTSHNVGIHWEKLVSTKVVDFDESETEPTGFIHEDYLCFKLPPEAEPYIIVAAMKAEVVATPENNDDALRILSEWKSK